MEARGKKQRWTYAEFARLPGEGGTRYEVIAGVARNVQPDGRIQPVTGSTRR